MNIIGNAYRKLMNESFYGNMVDTCRKWLDRNFVKSDVANMDENGFPTSKQLVTMVDAYRNPLKTMDDVQLFYMMQAKFKGMFSDEMERDSMLKQIIKDWYHGRISKYGSLSRY